MNTLSGLADFSPEKLPAPASTHYSKTDLTHAPSQFLDRSTLASWIKARESMLMLYARQLLPAGDRAYAEDVVQELFVKLLAQASSPGRLPMPK